MSETESIRGTITASPEAIAYDERFYNNHVDGSVSSAAVIVPIVNSLVRPKSVVDVGCGSGGWLKEFQKHGVTRLQGIDGEWVTPTSFCLEWDLFTSHCLEQPLATHARYDLAISLEVAEHLEQSAAETFVDTLVSLSDCILFSAAIPGQGGTRHINEQWPDYWAELFACRGYEVLDAIRPLIWTDKRVEVWYRQNCMIFANLQGRDVIAQAYGAEQQESPLSVVHPELFASKTAEHEASMAREPSLTGVLKQLPTLFIKALKRRLP